MMVARLGWRPRRRHAPGRLRRRWRPPEAKESDGPRLSARLERALDAELRKRVRYTGVPGASAALVFADGREWRGAAGAAVLEPRRAMSSATALPFDSVTKVATAALALRLAELDRLELDDPIGRWYRPVARRPAGHGARPARPHLRARRSARRVLAARAQASSRAREPAPVHRRDAPPGSAHQRRGILQRGLCHRGVDPRAGGARAARDGHAPRGAQRAGRRRARRSAGRAAAHAAGHSYWWPDGLTAEAADVSDGGSLLPSRTWAGMASTAGGMAGDVPSLARWAHHLLGGDVLARASLREMTEFRDIDFPEAYGLGSCAIPSTTASCGATSAMAGEPDGVVASPT